MPATATDRLYGLTTAVAIKPPCRVATTAAITLSGEQTVDGVAVVTDDRVLVKDQASSIDNGIYIVNTSAWTRSPDFDGPRDAVNGTLVIVRSGTVGVRTVWELFATDPVVIGTSALTFEQALLDDSATAAFLQAGTDAIQRTAQNKMRETVSITDFDGADPTGATDSSDALTAALAAADVVTLPVGGVFLVDGVTVDGKTIVGPGTLKWPDAATGPMLDLQGGAKLEGVKFDGNASGQSGSVHAITVTNSPFSRIALCEFTNFRYRGIVTDDLSTDGILIGCHFHDTGTASNGNPVNIRASRWTIQGSAFEDIGDSHCIRLGRFVGDVSTTPIRGVVISGCTFYNTDHCAITCEEYTQFATINGNYFEDLEQAVKCEIAGGTVYNITVSGNTMRNITLTTALNLTVPNVTFTGNNCDTMAGGPQFGANYVCVGNTFKNITDTGTAAVSQAAGLVGGVCANNSFHTIAYRAIVVTEDVVCEGNRIFSAAAGLHITGPNFVAKNNRIDTISGVGIQLTSAATSGEVSGNPLTNITGTTISFSDSNDGVLIGDNPGWSGSGFARSIASGAITVPRGAKYIFVDTESAAATDDLTTLNSAAYIGQTVILSSAANSRDITVKDGTGNIACGGDRVLDNAEDTITLTWNGTVWKEVAFASNGA